MIGKKECTKSEQWINYRASESKSGVRLQLERLLDLIGGPNWAQGVPTR